MSLAGALPQDLADVVTRTIAGQSEVDCVALFGSGATGRLRAASDIDLYVRLTPGARWATARRLSVEAALARALCREVDLTIEDQATSVILRREVASHGRALYESRAGAWIELCASAMLAYADLEPYLRQIGDATRARARGHG